MTAHTASTASPYRALSVAQGVRLVAAREVTTTLRSKAFIWSLAVTLVLIALVIAGQGVLGSVMGALFGGEKDTPVVVMNAEDAAALDAIGVSTVTAGSTSELSQMLMDDQAQAAYLPAADAAALGELFDAQGEQTGAVPAGGHVLVGAESVPNSLLQQLTVSPPAFTLEKSTGPSPLVGYFLALAFALLYFMSVMLFAVRIAQTVVEEKSSRIIELLLATLRPRTVLAGKIVGGTVLAMIQTVAVAIVAIAAAALTGQTGFVTSMGPAIGWFVVLFLFGFLLFATLYAAVGATVSRADDVASATQPLTFLAMVPYILIIVGNQNPVMMTWLSYIPFSSPAAMPVRLFMGEAQWWEPFVALAILIVTVLVGMVIGGRIYENSILRIGAKVKITDALKGA